MTLFDGLILGIIEGITEFLPISSTGHLILASSLLGVSQSDFTKAFEVIIQLGAILAVVVLYFRQLLQVELWKKLLTAFIPSAVVGLLFYHSIKSLMGNNLVVVFTLFLGGIIFIVFEKWHGAQENVADPTALLTYRQAFLIGLFQSLAVIPGVSRSGATILGGLALGVARPTIVEFSFLLAVPTMLAATGLDLLETSAGFSSSEWIVLAIGFTTAFVVAMPVVKWFLNYIRTHSFTSFGIYRIVLAVLFLIFFTV